MMGVVWVQKRNMGFQRKPFFRRLTILLSTLRVMVGGHVLNRLQSRLEQACQRQPLDLDYLEFICTSELTLITSLSAHMNFPQELDGDELLSDQQRDEINNLAFSWDLPAVNKANCRWLFQQLMKHAVIGRRTKQIKQIKKGLKNTKVWTLLEEKPETALIVFPRHANAVPTAQVFFIPLGNLKSNYVASYPLSLQNQTTGFLRKFETASLFHL
ncbi:hypothetical protein UPYG_G00022930 [Umbra pygmaea]|uniref:Uncharacterized protein n=1 Tax=Umbra pygmaea TaxID=75934 RepID=A0ABD0YA98_UMBPY